MKRVAPNSIAAELTRLRGYLALMAEYGVTHCPFGSGLIVRPFPPPPEPERKHLLETEFDKFKALNPDAQDARLKGFIPPGGNG
jgi:hypothetical protein